MARVIVVIELVHLRFHPIGLIVMRGKHSLNAFCNIKQCIGFFTGDDLWHVSKVRCLVEGNSNVEKNDGV